MQTQELITRYADKAAMLGIDLSTHAAVEKFRAERSGSFGIKTYKQNKHYRDIMLQLGVRAALAEGRDLIGEEVTPNIVTNQGLASVLSVYLDAATQITTWYLTLSASNTAAAATMTAASPAFTEITTTEVAETIRETWTGGAVTGTTTASIDNSAAVATYTADGTWTAYGAALIGGGTSAFGNTAGALYSYSLFASAKAMSVTDTIDVTYTFTSTDA